MSKRDEYQQRLTRVFREVFDDDDIEISDATTAADVEEWNSLSHVTLVVACEKEFGLKLSPAQVGRLKNVGQMLDVLVERGTR
jgi:acyl carrier protein